MQVLPRSSLPGRRWRVLKLSRSDLCRRPYRDSDPGHDAARWRAVHTLDGSSGRCIRGSADSRTRDWIAAVERRRSSEVAGYHPATSNEAGAPHAAIARVGAERPAEPRGSHAAPAASIPRVCGPANPERAFSPKAAPVPQPVGAARSGRDILESVQRAKMLASSAL